LTLAAKQRLVVGGLAVLAVWPMAHRVLVAEARLSPWRFFGWAMYCTPKLPVEIELTAVHDGARRALLPEELPPAVRQAVDRLADRRGVWGTFASADRLGTRLLASQPDAEAIEVGITHWYLDAATARIGTQRYAYTYRRE